MLALPLFQGFVGGADGVRPSVGSLFKEANSESRNEERTPRHPWVSDQSPESRLTLGGLPGTPVPEYVVSPFGFLFGCSVLVFLRPQKETKWRVGH